MVLRHVHSDEDRVLTPIVRLSFTLYRLISSSCGGCKGRGTVATAKVSILPDARKTTLFRNLRLPRKQ